jgi:ferredoxin/flavodoxin
MAQIGVTLAVFSQTGNTFKVAEAMAEALAERGHDVSLLPTTLFGPDEIDIPTAGLLGVGSPSIYGRAPVNVREYLSELPSLMGVPAFVFATSAGASGRVLTDLGQVLRAKGARIIGGVVSRGEVFHRAPWMRGRWRGHPDADDLQRAAGFALAAAARIEGGSRAPLPARDEMGGPLSRSDAHHARAGFYEGVSLLLSQRLMTRSLPQPELDEKTCTRCRWCVTNCPVSAIGFPEPEEWRQRAAGNGNLGEAPEIDERACIRCYRCLSCPVRAYDVDWAEAGRLLRVLYHPRVVELFGDL